MKKMKLQDLFEETFSALTVNKMRSGLTILGIVIGIGSVIAMISVGQGVQGSIEASIQSIGSNLILVMPGFQRGVGTQVSAGRGSAQTLTQEDADAIQKEITLAKVVAPEVSRRYQVTAKGTNTNTQVTGTNAFYAEVRNVEIDTGSFITDQNVSGLSKVAVLGPTTRDDLFGEGAGSIGQTIRIDGINFKVIGVTKSRGGTGFSNQDDAIYIPLSTAQKFLTGGNYVTTISVQTDSQNDMAAAQEQITSLLLPKEQERLG